MKKILSVLLALAVAFTFTFGSTMSAFADTNTYPNAGSNLDKAYQTASAAVANETFYVDYDANNTIVMAEAPEENLVTYTFTAAAAKAAVDKAYKQIESEPELLANIEGKSDIEKQAIYYTAIMNAVVGSQYSLATGTAINVSNVTDVMFATDFEAYKAALIEAVGKVDISDYSTTDYKTNQHYVSGNLVGYTSKDGETYDNSALAAKADIDWANTIIGNATLNTAVTNTTDMTQAWRTASFNALYTTIFGAANIITVTENPSKATVKYTLSNGSNYSTISGEKLAGNNKTNIILINKTALSTYLANNFVYADLDKTEQEEYDAYNAAQTWLIENYAAPYNAVVTFANSPLVTSSEQYTDAAALVKYANDKAAIVKAMKNSDGTLTYDAEKVDLVLNAVVKANYSLENTYNTEAKIDDALTNINNKASYVTSSVIVRYLVDYSTVTATGAYDDPISINMSKASSTIGTRAYYAKEWETVKAAIDTYNAAVKAAKTMDDIEAAQAAFYKAVKDVKDATTVAGLTCYTADAANLIAYVSLATNAAKAADKNVAGIFVKFGKAYIAGSDVATSTPSVDNSVKGWYIDKGARTAADVTALTAEAKAIIDAYKTDVAIRDAANAVKAAIAALPAKVTLADKDAIQAAKDAYDELAGTGYQGLVSNSATLSADIAAVKKLEKKAVEDAIKALPSTTKVTIADKAAVKAANDANDAYVSTPMYNLTDSDATGAGTIADLLDAIRVLEAKDLNAKIEALAAKDITTADADAVKAAREAFEAYVAEYGVANASTVVISDMEAKLASVEKALAVAEEAAVWTATDVKASLFDSSRKLTIWRTSKTSIRVTSVGSVADIKDHGYTVKYKFYKKAPGSSTYKLIKTTTSNKYTYTNLKKGTNKFQVKVCVYDADGKLVASKWTYYRAAKIK